MRGSLLLDILSHSLVALHLSSSSLVFAGITSLSALAAGSTPALHSLAISILQRSRQGSPEIGALFGGLSMLTAVGQILSVSSSSTPLAQFLQFVLIVLCSHLDLQPLTFGVVYSTTVARFPEAVFALAAALVLVALGMTFLVRTEPPHVWKGKAPAAVARRRVLIPERERGRSRTVKHIGDRLRKPALNNASAGAGVSTASSSRAGPGDEAV